MALKNYDENVRKVVLEENNLWNEMCAIIFAHSFPYEVIYTDGFVSSDKEDMKGRTPFGILVCGVILRIDAPDRKMKLDEAYCLIKDEVFAGLKCYLPPIYVLKFILKHMKSINRELEELGGDKIFGDWYASSNEFEEDPGVKVSGANRILDVSNKKVYAVHMNLRDCVNMSYTTKDDESYIRLAYPLL